MDKIKMAADSTLHVVERSEQVGLGLYSLSTLMTHYANSGKDIDETQIRGLSVIIDSLSDQLTGVPNEYLESINTLKGYCQQ